MRQQRHARLNTKTTDAFRRHQGDFRQLLRRRIVIDVGVGDKGVTAWQQQRVHGPRGADAVPVAEQRLNHPIMLMVVADGAADHGIRLATMHHDCANDRRIGNHRPLRLLLGHAAAFHDLVILAPVLFKARIGFVIDDLKIHAGFDLQPQLLDTHFNHARTADQNRFCQPQRYQLLSCVQDARLFAFRQHHAPGLFARLGENRLHEQVSFVDKLAEFLNIGVEVGNRTRGYTGVHCRFGDRRSDLDDQARIERFRNDIFRTKAQILIAVGRGDHFALFGMCQFRYRVDCSQLHLFVNRRGANVQRPAEDEREAQHVVDLVRVVRTPGADDGIFADLLRQRRQNLRFRVSQGEDQRRAGHFFHHLRGQHFRA